MSFFVEVNSPLGNFASTFESEQEANAWIEAQEANGSWGKPERWITFDNIDYTNKEVTPSNPELGHIDSREVEITFDDGSKSFYTEYLYPKQWTVTGPTDISAQVQEQENLARRKKQREFGGECIDLISYMLEQKDLDAQQGGQVISSYQAIIANLQLGNINDARTLVAAASPDSIITQDEIDALLLKIDAFLS